MKRKRHRHESPSSSESTHNSSSSAGDGESSDSAQDDHSRRRRELSSGSSRKRHRKSSSSRKKKSEKKNNSKRKKKTVHEGKSKKKSRKSKKRERVREDRPEQLPPAVLEAQAKLARIRSEADAAQAAEQRSAIEAAIGREGGGGLGPMTANEAQRDSERVRKVYEPETGRVRLVRGSGEIIEQIVSREEQEAIRKRATMMPTATAPQSGLTLRAVETTKQKGPRRKTPHRPISPGNRKACRSISTPLMHSVAKITTQRTMKSSRKKGVA